MSGGNSSTKTQLKDKQLKLDDTDLIMLYELLQDGRKSFADLAKDCNTTKGVIARRFKRMEKRDVIVGATIQNTVECYNCNSKMIAVITLFTESDKNEQILKSLDKFPQIVQVMKPSTVDPVISLTVVLEDSEEFKMVRQQLLNLPFVKQLDSDFFLGSRNHPENLSIFNTRLKSEENKKNRKIKLDEIDKLLIEVLAVNGRMTFGKIAQELRSNIVTISRRYERLRDNGYIRVVIRIDPRKIGYPGFTGVRVKCLKADKTTLNALSEIPDITQIQKIGGEFDYFAILMLRDLEHLFITQNRISSISGVTKIQEFHISPLFSPWPTFREFKSTE
jgi:DNA-binding Lrp family transcriptional regulator